jgi:DNA-binding CsgD family transcriptional regulator
MRRSEQGNAKAFPARAPSPGFLFADSSLRPIYANAEAIEILAYPEDHKKTKSLEKFLAKKVRSLFAEQQGTAESALLTQVRSGRRRYLCRAFTLAPSRKGSLPAMAVLIERNPGFLDTEQMARKFRLTQREREAVELLALGLTSKEIGSRMRISSNTVKAFLRLVMIKMGVFTRSGILGKLVQSRS